MRRSRYKHQFIFVPEYKNEHGETVGKYEIIKNEGLIEMDIKIYEYC